MNGHISRRYAVDLGSMENQIQQRLQRGKIKLLISHILLFILTVSAFLFVI